MKSGSECGGRVGKEWIWRMWHSKSSKRWRGIGPREKIPDRVLSGDGKGGALALAFLGGPWNRRGCGRERAGRVAFRQATCGRGLSGGNRLGKAAVD